MSQIQDIAGCRVVVEDIVEQDRLLAALSGQFAIAIVIDRRIKPSHGYRAIHVVVEVDGHAVEIQLRTRLQHLWAELSEKLSDIFDPGLKYGVGDQEDLELLRSASEFVRGIEDFERDVAAGVATDELRANLNSAREHLAEFLVDSIADVPQLGKDDLPD